MVFRRIYPEQHFFLGPNVTRTVSANLFTPFSRAALASAPYLISFAISIYLQKIMISLNYSTTAKISDCLDDHIFFAFKFYFCSCIFGINNGWPTATSIFTSLPSTTPAGTYCDNFRFLWFFFLPDRSERFRILFFFCYTLF